MSASAVQLAAWLMALLVLGPQERSVADGPGVLSRITGRVLGLGPDAIAVPVQGARVVLTLDATGAVVATALSDESGAFLFDTPPGRYRLRGSRAGYVSTEFGAFRPGEPGTPIAIDADASSMDAELRLLRVGAVSGVIRTASGDLASNVTVTAITDVDTARPDAERQQVLTDSRGMYRLHDLAPGLYFIAVAATTRSRAVEPLYFYPGVGDATQAELVSIEPGRERGGVDLYLPSAAPGRLSGMVTGVDGSPVEGQQIRVETLHGPFQLIRQQALAAKGDFEFSGLRPGRYALVVQQTASSPTGRSLITTMASARMVVDVLPDATTSVALRLEPAARISGTITVGNRDPFPNGARLLLDRTDRPGLPSAARIEGGEFRFDGLVPGSYRFRIEPGDSWWLVAATAGPATLLNGFQIGPGTPGLTDVRLTATNERSTLQGTVRDRFGRPATAYWVVLIPRSIIYSDTLRLQRTRPGTDGAFFFRNIPTGDFVLSVLGDVAEGEWRQPGLIEALAATGTSVQVRFGRTTTQDLLISTGPSRN